jgi:hypothetical protein
MKRSLIIWLLSVLAVAVLFFIRHPGRQRYEITIEDQGWYALDRINGELVVVGPVGGMMQRPPQPEINNAPWFVDLQHSLMRKPWAGGIEIYEQRGRYLRIRPNFANSTPMPLPDMSEVKAAMQIYLDQTTGGDLNTILSTQTKFLPKETRESVIRLFLYFLASVLLTGIIETPRLIKHIRIQRRLRLGLCTECAYHLSGVPSPICPECGHNHAQAQSA